jgi:hypothetical protein
MLGELISEETGQITGLRVLPDEVHARKVEVSFQQNGTLLGLHVSDIGTYISVTRPDGSLFGEGQGITLTEDGEAAAWRGQGVGRLTGQGMAVTYRGAIYYETTSDRLARLNDIALVYEYEADESGKISTKSYEWK